MNLDAKIGGPCPICRRSQPQCAADGCAEPGCAYNRAHPDPKQVAARLARMMRLLIAAEGLEQNELAVEIGVGESTLSRFLSGRGSPDAAGFSKILTWCIQQ